MKMMRALLQNVGRSWNVLPQDIPVLTVTAPGVNGTFPHKFVTVTHNELIFHNITYRKGLPEKISISLDGMTLGELATFLTNMEVDFARPYYATLTSEGAKIAGQLAIKLMPVENLPLTGRKTFTLTAFSSKLWEVLYPIARLLQEADGDVDRAIEQMMAPMSRGRWLEYWASFFKVKRVTGESDSSLANRMMLALANIKTNNIAIEQLVRIALQTKQVEVRDLSPALFEVVIEPEFIGTSSLVHPIIQSLKGAGIDYFLNYAKQLEENYRASFFDREFQSFITSDKRTMDAEARMRETPFGHTQGHQPFRLNITKLVTGRPILDTPKRILRDDASLVLEPAWGEFYPLLALQKTTTSRFRLNSGRLNRTESENTLYGTVNYGAIMDGTMVELVEGFPNPSEAIGTEMAHVEQLYREPVVRGSVGFRLNFSKVMSGATLSRLDERVSEEGSMTLTRGGTTVQSMTW